MGWGKLRTAAVRHEPQPSRCYYVYIMTSRSYTSLYTGVTNEPSRRVWQHKHQPSGFAKRYRTSILVYCEETSDIREAIAREKQIKHLHRAQKTALIESQNPGWRDLSEAPGAPLSPPDPV
ncbi:MAG TPA: GIY-YIG nuclease family protein [Dehalococcoidia bacterium]|nr:GIY-YIG nuclease family protein [Dehalococcoidia bacterium]